MLLIGDFRLSFQRNSGFVPGVLSRKMRMQPWERVCYLLKPGIVIKNPHYGNKKIIATRFLNVNDFCHYICHISLSFVNDLGFYTTKGLSNEWISQRIIKSVKSETWSNICSLNSLRFGSICILVFPKNITARVSVVLAVLKTDYLLSTGSECTQSNVFDRSGLSKASEPITIPSAPAARSNGTVCVRIPPSAITLILSW